MTAARPARATAGSNRVANGSVAPVSPEDVSFPTQPSHTRRDDTGLGMGTAAKSPSWKIIVTPASRRKAVDAIGRFSTQSALKLLLGF